MQKINDPEEIDWVYFWRKKLEAKKDRGKDWNKAAPILESLHERMTITSN